jgi:hypothetical protein
MHRFRTLLLVALAACGFSTAVPAGKDDKGSGIKVDKEKGTVTIDAKIAPRKLPIKELEGKIMPIEVIACWPYPKGQKAHETVVTIDVLPSDVHKALTDLGIKPGKPLMGESKQPPQGPDVKVYLEVPDVGGTRKISIDKTLVDRNNGKPFPKDVKWRFTGSAMVQPDPNKKDTKYGADESGTLIVIFPVSDKTVMQTSLTMEYERFLKLDTNTKLLPKEGTPVKLVLEVEKK